MRTARITRDGERDTKCFAASKPRPVFEPVTMKVLLAPRVGVEIMGSLVYWSETNREKDILGTDELKYQYTRGIKSMEITISGKYVLEMFCSEYIYGNCSYSSTSTFLYKIPANFVGLLKLPSSISENGYQYHSIASSF